MALVLTDVDGGCRTGCADLGSGAVGLLAGGSLAEPRAAGAATFLTTVVPTFFTTVCVTQQTIR